MGKVILTLTTTVDGVMTVEEWYVSEGEHNAASRAQFDGAAGMLMGRKTFEGLAEYWSPQTGEWADKLNPMSKYVASRTLEGALDWNGTVIDGDVAAGVSRLKEDLDGDLMLIGGGELARHLVADSLVDEFRFWMHPFVWGKGQHPFEGREQLRLNLIEAKAFDSGVTLLRYEPAGRS